MWCLGAQAMPRRSKGGGPPLAPTPTHSLPKCWRHSSWSKATQSQPSRPPKHAGVPSSPLGAHARSHTPRVSGAPTSNKPHPRGAPTCVATKATKACGFSSEGVVGAPKVHGEHGHMPKRWVAPLLAPHLAPAVWVHPLWLHVWGQAHVPSAGGHMYWHVHHMSGTIRYVMCKRNRHVRGHGLGARAHGSGIRFQALGSRF
jgi:hypothetical protein